MKTLQRQRIDLYKSRTFSETLSAVFDFVSENFRPLFRMLAVFLLPICLIGGVCYSVLIDQTLDTEVVMARQTDNAVTSVLLNYGVMIVLALLAGAVLSGVVYTLMQQYYARQERLQGITYADIKATVWKNIGRMLAVSLVVGVIMVVLLVLTVTVVSLTAAVSSGILLPAVLGLVLGIGLLACVLSLLLVFPTRIFGRLSLGGSLKQAMRYGFRINWRLFSTLFILYIICSLVSMAMGIPYYILVMLKGIAAVDDSALQWQFTSAAWFVFVSYLSSIVLLFGSYLSMSLMYLGVAFCYGHAAEKIDGLSMQQSIDDFEMLSNSQPKAEIAADDTAESEIDNFEKL